MGVHASHRVLIGLMCSLARKDIDLRIVGYHALVHAVECQTLSVRTPERTFLDAELVAVYALSIDDLATAVGAQLVLLAFAVNHKQLMVLYVSRCA